MGALFLTVQVPVSTLIDVADTGGWAEITFLATGDGVFIQASSGGNFFLPINTVLRLKIPPKTKIRARGSTAAATTLSTVLVDIPAPGVMQLSPPDRALLQSVVRSMERAAPISPDGLLPTGPQGSREVVSWSEVAPNGKPVQRPIDPQGCGG